MSVNEKEKLPMTVDQELTEMLFKSAGLSNSMQIVIAAAVFIILKDAVEQDHLTIWISTLVFITLGRMAFVSLYWERRKQHKPISNCLNAYLLLLYLNAATWGMLIFIPMVTVKIGILSFISFVVAGLSAGALMSLSALLRAAIPYLLLVLLPVLIYFAIREEARYIVMAGMIGLYICLLIYTSININRMLKNAFKIDAANDALYSFLKQAKDKLDKKIYYYKTAIDKLERKIRLRNNFFEYTSTPICVIDMTSNIIEANTAFIHLTGIDLIKDQTAMLSSCIHTDDLQAFEDSLSHVYKDHIRTRERYRLKTVNGDYEACDVQLEYIYDLVNTTILRL